MANITFSGATLDSRQVKPGMLFVAIKGEHVDGHDFIPQAKAAGAAGIIDGKEDLAATAREYRKTLKATVIGVTGSYGKTSVKFFLEKLLSVQYNVLVTPLNYNTTLGVVRTIRERLRAQHQLFVCEMGARNVGDIKEICDLVDYNNAAASGQLAAFGVTALKIIAMSVVLTVLLLLATWGILWSQHKMEWNHITVPLVMTIASVAALVAARFPFMMSDAEEHKDMNQISVSVKKEQIYALIFAIMALLAPIIDFKWGLIEIIFVVILVEAFFDHKKKSAHSSEQGTDKAFDSSNIQVTHDKEEMAFYIVTGFIILTAMCFVLLSLDAIKADFMRQSARLIFILLTAYTAFTQLVKAVKFTKADKSIENIRQFRLNVLEERVFGVEFAIISLILAIGIKHHIIDAATLFVAIIATLLGTYFIFHTLIKKAR